LLALSQRCAVWPLALPAGLARLADPLRRADLVLLDPPYGGEAARDCLEALGRAGALSREARVVVEHHSRDTLPERSGSLERARQRQYGETVVSTYRIAPPARAGGAPAEELI
jgi:16S rRNA G966 N2-methylase RsmD